MQIKKIIQSFNPRYRKDKKALANLARMANESYQELCNPDNKTEYQQRAEQFLDQIKATILDPRFLSLSKSIQKNNLLNLLDDQASIFFEPLIFEFTRALGGIYSPEELKTFCEQIKEPGGLYKTFKFGLVEIDSTKKLPQVALFLKSSGSPYLEALAEILHSIRLIDVEENPGRSDQKKNNINRGQTHKIEYDITVRENLIKCLRVFDEEKIITLPTNFNLDHYFGSGLLDEETFKQRTRIDVHYSHTYGLIALLKYLDRWYGCEVATIKDRPWKLIKEIFSYNGAQIKEKSVAAIWDSTEPRKIEKIDKAFEELDEILKLYE